MDSKHIYSKTRYTNNQIVTFLMKEVELSKLTGTIVEKSPLQYLLSLGNSSIFSALRISLAKSLGIEKQIKTQQDINMQMLNQMVELELGVLYFSEDEGG